MKIKDLWNEYQFLTQTLTENCRKLAFAGAAICWFFKTENYTFPPNILRSLIFIVAFFIFDLTHYLTSALILKIWTRKKEKEMWEEHKTLEKDIDKPNWLDKPGYYLFLLKIISLLISFGFLINEFLVRI